MQMYFQKSPTANCLYSVLEGLQRQTSKLSQTLTDLVVGEQYTLAYYYRRYGTYIAISSPLYRCTVSVTIGGVLVDTLPYPTTTVIYMAAYAARTATYTAISSSADLVFTNDCSTVVLSTALQNVAVDEISLTHTQ